MEVSLNLPAELLQLLCFGVDRTSIFLRQIVIRYPRMYRYAEANTRSSAPLFAPLGLVVETVEKALKR